MTPWRTGRGLLLVLTMLLCFVNPASATTLKWLEEVALQDGGIIVVSRRAVFSKTYSLDGKRELSFKHPTTGKIVTWKNAGHRGSRLKTLLLDLDAGRPYLVTLAQSIGDYNEFGCPTPPYIVFRHDDPNWTRVSLSELPARFQKPNMLMSASHAEDVIREAKFYVTAERVAQRYKAAVDKDSHYVSIDRRLRNPIGLGCNRGTVDRVYGAGKYLEWRGTGRWTDRSPEDAMKLLRGNNEARSQ